MPAPQPQMPAVERAAVPAVAPPTSGQKQERKVVTAVFSDLTGSTAMGEKLDPETVQTVMSRYFAKMSEILQAHGGTVEKFIGDAIVAVFGVPVVHEDDALRAVRATVEMRRAMDEMNAEFMQRWGFQLLVRTGVNTGEVIATDTTQGDAFSTGDTMNVAARLEQNAPPGEILIGEATYKLVSHAAVLEEVEPLTLKGKSKQVPAWKVVDVEEGSQAIDRKLNSILVGRDDELDTMLSGYGKAVDERACQLFTVFGPAGVGKSRLTAEFLKRVSEGDGDFPAARVLQGRCLPYGTGITFWALGEAVKGASGITDEDTVDEARRKMEALIGADPEAPVISERISAAIGLTQESLGGHEIQWAVRKMFEALAGEQPLVVFFDDIHWAEQTFLEMLEYLVSWTQDAPIFLLCPSRKELLETRPDWGSGRPNMTTMVLEPLSAEDTEKQVANLLGQTGLPRQVVDNIVTSAEGNPLFVEEMVRILIDDGVLEKRDGRWEVTSELDDLTVPPTIQALLSARLDKLREPERAVIQEASVIGKTFWWGAVTELSPEDLKPQVGSHLQTLVRKELVFPERSTFPAEDAFLFGHILIRDSAYDGLAKMVRAQLHERFAMWLEAKMGDRVVEYEEILGYHLEQAANYHNELGSPVAMADAIAERASLWLGRAGRRALDRSDMPAAAGLLQRAADLLGDHDLRRLELLLDLSDALKDMGELSRAEDVCSEGERILPTLQDRRLQARFEILRAVLELHTGRSEGSEGETLRRAQAAISVFEELGDEIGLSQAHQLQAEVHWDEGEFVETETALERALVHAENAQDAREKSKILSWLVAALFWGPTHTEEAIRRCEEILESAKDDRLVEAKTLTILAGLEGMRGDFDKARDLFKRGQGIQVDLGQELSLAAGPQVSGMIEMLAGDPIAAEGEFRRGYEELDRMGDKGFLVTTAAFLARALYEQGRYDEAAELTRISEELTPPEDVTARGDWVSTEAKIVARKGDFERAEKLAREALDIFKEEGQVRDRADALVDLAEVLYLAGRKQEVAGLLEEAIRLYEVKGIVPSIERTRARLAEVTA
ncbi:MAG: AAA family ATPase [Actinomycetota bacterium]|nr:AAA family ATPase [Actinomycetota bacterium]